MMSVPGRSSVEKNISFLRAEDVVFVEEFFVEGILGVFGIKKEKYHRIIEISVSESKEISIFV
jgi:hypothetical protein